MISDLLIQNKELLKAIYGLTIVSISALIFLRADRFFKLSDHQGIRYFRNAFFFYGAGFFSKFILLKLQNPLPEYDQAFFEVVGILANFLILLASFFLLYSLIWRKIEKEKNYHSVLNLKMIPLYFTAAIVIYIDASFRGFFEISQVVIFATMCFISFEKVIKSNFKKESSAYLITILMGLLTAIFSYLSLIGPSWWGRVDHLYVYIPESAFFLAFLILAYRMTRIR